MEIQDLKLERPLVFLDLETTGPDPQKDQIVEIAVVKLMPDGTSEEKEMKIKPSIPICDAAYETHGISMESLASCPAFAQIANSLLAYLDGCDIGGYNSNKFDIPILMREFQRVGLVWDLSDTALVDSWAIEVAMNSNTLASVYKRYTGREIENAHAALPDVRATMEVFKAQLGRMDVSSVREADLFAQKDKKRVDVAGVLYEKEGVVYWSYGKYKNKPIDTDKGYVQWVLKSDFMEDTKQNLRKLLKL